jgi:hypothetical protein
MLPLLCCLAGHALVFHELWPSLTLHDIETIWTATEVTLRPIPGLALS